MSLESLRTLLALATIRGLDGLQFDITSLCLHGTLKEELYTLDSQILLDSYWPLSAHCTHSTACSATIHQRQHLCRL
jgi:hypothetical protein